MLQTIRSAGAALACAGLALAWPPLPSLGAPIAPSAWSAYRAAAAVPTPSELFGPLYAQVETRTVFADNKVFADATPKRSVAEILAAYREGAPWSDEALRAFVLANFTLPSEPSPAAVTAHAAIPMDEHIARLWPILTRRGGPVPPGGSALSLPRPYVVPGGRFRELYYWDSYFTMLGLQHDGRQDLVESMIDDFGSLIDRYGHIPNGTRTYYLTRSQPPFFYAMVGLSKAADPEVRARRLGWMMHEHAFWMIGAKGLKPGEAHLHVVAMPDGTILNRYFDLAHTPRDESYAIDRRIAAQSGLPASQVYGDLRAAAESGWDFSSRWLMDGRSLETIHTGDLVEPDLNSLLYGLERAIATQCRRTGALACAADYDRQAQMRASAMRRWLWDRSKGLYRDYDWRTGRQTPAASAATLYPLFVGLATPEEARRIADFVGADLLAPGGLRTTTVTTGQQWDEPNGWAPLQWIAASGLSRYGEGALAESISCRWLHTVALSYAATGKLVEKYNVENVGPGGGGEYPLQDGFGWTNGVAAALHCSTAYQRPDQPQSKKASGTSN